jgi:Family of unknown function (DUF5343)
MALPTAYLTTVKNLNGILAAIQTAKPPPTFTQKFLGDLGYKSSSDRLIINVLKALGFLSSDGVPTQRYFEYLDQTQAGRVMAEGVMQGYADLFELNTKAHKMERAELVNKLRTLSQGQLTDAVVKKMAMTFKALADHGDFDAANAAAAGKENAGDDSGSGDGEDGIVDKRGGEGDGGGRDDSGGSLAIDGLVYNIQIQLPESRDPKVYDALFQSLSRHLKR